MSDNADGFPASVVVCTQCGQAIGQYFGNDGKVYLQVGTILLRDAWGWCQDCGQIWTFHSSDKQVEELVEHLQRLRNS